MQKIVTPAVTEEVCDVCGEVLKSAGMTQFPIFLLNGVQINCNVMRTPIMSQGVPSGMFAMGQPSVCSTCVAPALTKFATKISTPMV